VTLFFQPVINQMTVIRSGEEVTSVTFVRRTLPVQPTNVSHAKLRFCYSLSLYGYNIHERINTEHLSVQIIGTEPTDICMNMLLDPSHDWDFRVLQGTHYICNVFIESVGKEINKYVMLKELT
jgi:hypothetical protein